MEGKAPAPLFTLRGHNIGVTAISSFQHEDNTYLVSGDEQGSLMIWDLSTFRKLRAFSRLLSTRVQSLKVITFGQGSKDDTKVLVAQSRDNGIKLINLNLAIHSGEGDLQPEISKSFASFESLFSRGDAINIGSNEAILAYPSSIANCLITIRIINSAYETQISGTADRYGRVESSKNCSVFDVSIKEDSDSQFNLFVAYEDGCLCVFRFSRDSTETIPALNITGLKIKLVKTINFKINDFMSAFDIDKTNTGDMIGFCGSPKKDLLVFTCSPDLYSDPTVINNLDLGNPGTSSISIRPDKRLVAVAGWDRMVRLYSMKSHQLLAILNYHTKQVNDILFVEKPHIHTDIQTLSQGQSSSSEFGRYFLCCASKEGTISITDIY